MPFHLEKTRKQRLVVFSTGKCLSPELFVESFSVTFRFLRRNLGSRRGKQNK